jgi:hypothetical protein
VCLLSKLLQGKKLTENVSISFVVNILTKSCVSKLVKKWWATGSVCDIKKQSKKIVLTEEKVRDIEAQLQISPRKSLRGLAQETGVSLFFQKTVNSDRHVNDILNQLTAEERQYGYFQQDNATAHTANAAMVAILEVFEDRIIRRGLWPLRSLFLRFLYLGKPKGESLEE